MAPCFDGWDFWTETPVWGQGGTPLLLEHSPLNPYPTSTTRDSGTMSINSPCWTLQTVVGSTGATELHPPKSHTPTWTLLLPASSISSCLARNQSAGSTVARTKSSRNLGLGSVSVTRLFRLALRAFNSASVRCRSRNGARHWCFFLEVCLHLFPPLPTPLRNSPSSLEQLSNARTTLIFSSSPICPSGHDR